MPSPRSPRPREHHRHITRADPFRARPTDHPCAAMLAAEAPREAGHRNEDVAACVSQAGSGFCGLFPRGGGFRRGIRVCWRVFMSAACADVRRPAGTPAATFRGQVFHWRASCFTGGQAASATPAGLQTNRPALACDGRRGRRPLHFVGRCFIGRRDASLAGEPPVAPDLAWPSPTLWSRSGGPFTRRGFLVYWGARPWVVFWSTRR